MTLVIDAGLDNMGSFESFGKKTPVDMPGRLACLGQGRLLYSGIHMFSGLTGHRVDQSFRFFAVKFPALEALNGPMQKQESRTTETACDQLASEPMELAK